MLSCCLTAVLAWLTVFPWICLSSSTKGFFQQILNLGLAWELFPFSLLWLKKVLNIVIRIDSYCLSELSILLYILVGCRFLFRNHQFSWCIQLHKWLGSFSSICVFNASAIIWHRKESSLFAWHFKCLIYLHRHLFS